jgi:hypothetical protein
MSNGIQFFLSLRLVRRVSAILAFLAVTTALAQPFCDLHPDEALHQEDCCASLTDGNLAVPANAVVPDVKSPAVLPSATTALTAWRPAQGPVVAIPPDRQPISRPYHVRSARILI